MKKLVDLLVKEGVIKSKRVADVMMSVDRRDFVVDPLYAYVDSP